VNRMKTRSISVVLGTFILLAGALDASLAETPLPQTAVPSPAASQTPSPLPTVQPTSTPSIPQRLEALESRVDDLGKFITLSRGKTIADIVESVFTVIAFVLSGAWAYTLFVRKRQRYPRARILHRITHKPISDDKVLLHVGVVISNPGEILISLVSLEVRIQQVLPPAAELLDLLSQGQKLVKQGESEVAWPLIESRELSFDEREIEIEPGERERIPFDFVIDAEVQTVEVYSYIKNEVKRDREIGWNLTTLYDLDDRVANGNESHS